MKPMLGGWKKIGRVNEPEATGICGDKNKIYVGSRNEHGTGAVYKSSTLSFVDMLI